MSTTPRTDAIYFPSLNGSWFDTATALRDRARELETELAAVTAERDALALPRPYDTYWSRRALELEAKLKAITGNVVAAIDDGSLKSPIEVSVSIPSPSNEEPKMDKPFTERLPLRGFNPAHG